MEIPSANVQYATFHQSLAVAGPEENRPMPSGQQYDSGAAENPIIATLLSSAQGQAL